MRTYKASRRELFERLDKPALTPLPAQPFEASTWKKVGLNIDYHVAFEDHFYSASHTLRHEDIELWLRATVSTVEIFHGRERSPRTLEATSVAASRRRPSTCRAVIARTPNGRRRASSVGPTK